MKGIFLSKERLRNFLDSGEGEKFFIIMPPLSDAAQYRRYPNYVKDINDRFELPDYKIGEIIGINELYHINEHGEFEYEMDSDAPGRKWTRRARPEKGAMRYFAEVTNVQAAHLQDVMTAENKDAWNAEICRQKKIKVIKKGQKKEVYFYEQNPWVWAVSFKRYIPEDPTIN